MKILPPFKCLGFTAKNPSILDYSFYYALFNGAVRKSKLIMTSWFSVVKQWMMWLTG